MDALAGIEFRDASLLWLLFATPFVLAILMWRERTRLRRATRFVAERLRGDASPLRPLRPWILTAGTILGLLGLAGPRAGFTIQRIPGAETSTVILLDTSLSMNAEDVGTSRLTGAKAIARRILEADRGRLGLVVFEGSADVVAPMTDDHAAVETLIESIGAGELAEAGSDIGRAMETGLAMIARAGSGRASMIVLSDGEHRGAAYDDATRHAAERGVAVTTVLVGGPVAVSIPGEQNALRDERGNVVRTQASDKALRDIARRTGGDFFSNPFSAGDARRLAESIESKAVVSGEQEREIRVPVERFQWPLGAAFFLFLAASVLHRGAE